MAIKDQLVQEYVGEIVELYEIDLNPLGQSIIYRLTPHADEPISWQGEVFSPFPINITGMDRSYNKAPGRVKMEASTASTLMTSLMIQYGDLVGAKVKKWRTLSMYLDGKPTSDPAQHWPVENYVIIQRETLSVDGVRWILATNIDKPGNILPRRQCLKEDISRRGLYCPGMSRWRAS